MKWNFCLNFIEHKEKKKNFSASEGERDEQASEKHTTSQWSNTSKLHRNYYSPPYSVIHGRKIICQQARPLNPSKKKSTKLVHDSPSERMNNSQKASWKTDWKSDRTKFVLYLFPLGGVNGITGPIKFWCRGKRRFLCVYVLPQHRSLSIHVCVRMCLSVWLNKGKTASLFLGMGQAQWLREYSGWSVAFQWKGAVSVWVTHALNEQLARFVRLHPLSTSSFVPFVFPCNHAMNGKPGSLPKTSIFIKLL